MRALVCLVSLALVAVACGSGGPGTVGTGAPSDGTPPVSGDRAPSSNERAPSSTDPTGTSSPNGCYACVRWVCTSGKQTINIDLAQEPDGSCTFLNAGQKVDPCGTTTFKPTNDVTTTFAPHGTSLRVCYSLTQSSSVCLDCVAAK